MGDPVLHVSDDHQHAVASVGAVFIFFSRRPLDTVSVRWFADLFRRHRQAHPTAFGFLSYSEADAGVRPSMDAPVRRAFLDAIRVGEEAKAALVVFTRGGFIGATFRAFLAGLLLAARLPVPTKTFATLDEGLPWFLAELRRGGLTPDTAELRRTVDLMREATAAQRQ